MIEVLKRNYPESSIDFLINKRVAELVEDFPNINKVHSIEKDSIKDIRNICLANSYNLAIVVHPTFYIAIAIYLAKIKYRLGTGYRWYSFLFNIRHYQHRKHSIKHEVEYNLDLLKTINCEVPEKIEMYLNVTEGTIKSLKSKINESDNELESNYIVIHIGSLGSANAWNVENFINLINLLNTDNDLKFDIVLTGSESEKGMLDNAMDKLTDKKKVKCITNLNLKELAGLIKNANMFISNSTGPIHIAAAVGTFIIGLYPSKKQESSIRWGPYTERKKLFISNSFSSNNKNLDDIKPIEVYNFIKSYFTE